MDSKATRTDSLLEINKAITASIHLDTVLQTIIDKSVELLGLDTGAIYLLDDQQLYMGATTPPIPPDFPEIFRHDRLEHHDHIREAMFTGKGVPVNNTSQEPFTSEEQKIVEVRQLKSILYIPLILEKRPVGIMILGTIHEYRTFQSQETDLYQAYSSHAALAIENAILYRNSLRLIEELKQQNIEFQKINKDLVLAREKALENERLKTAFIQNISHEIRTPLNAICGFASLINSPDISEKQRMDYASIIQNSGNQLLSIVTDILTISSIETGQEKVLMHPVNINDILHEIGFVYRQQAEKQRLDLRIREGLSGAEAEIKTDRAKLSRIISNLVSNALKFTREGKVELGYLKKDENLLFYVKDTGIGIKPDQQLRIFDRFCQGDMIENGTSGGTGLGLSISKGYVELLEGRIWVESEYNNGSAFYFTIPYESVSVSPSSIKERNSKEKGFSVLIAEDEEFNYLYLEVLLKTQGINVIHAKNGRDAVELCREHQMLDLIIMDIKMPVMDGYTAAALIKEFRPRLPIIAYTAYEMDTEKSDLLQLFDHYLSKPVSEREFLAALKPYFKGNGVPGN